MLVLGHRGASAHHPDNTVGAFRAAMDQGADGVELDVRRTADGALALRHDAVLDDGRILVELAAADLPPEMAFLDQALDVCAEAALVNVEIKNWPHDPDFDEEAELVDRVVALLEERGQASDPRLLLSSFHFPTVDRIREVGPGLPTAYIVVDVPEPEPLVARSLERGHVAIHPHQAFVTPELVEVVHAAGLALNTWTCDDPDRLRWLADVGVDAVIANDPAAALTALGR
jgi:glycerophosphoryl diester phosphodiesterase